MDAFERGRSKTASVEKQAVQNHEVLARIATGRLTRSNYAAYLVETYHLVTETPHFLTAAAASCRGDLWLRDWLMDLAVEERGHDALCVNDLRTLGVDPSPLLREHPGQGAWSMISQNHYLATRLSPVGIVGFAAATEHLGANLASRAAHQIEDRLPFARGATTFLKVHGHADATHIDHVRTAYIHCSEVEHNEFLMNDVWRLTLLFYGQLLTDVLARGDQWLT